MFFSSAMTLGRKLLLFPAFPLFLPALSTVLNPHSLFIDDREFVSSVWCIKILSPQEVQQMGKRGLELLNSAPSSNNVNKLPSNGNCDDFGNRSDPRNLGNGIASVGGSFNY